MRRANLLLFLAAILSTGVIVGCYTVLRHPADLDYTAIDDLDRDNACLDCHVDSHYYHWSDPYYSSYYSYPAPWDVYYGQAWWYSPHDQGEWEYEPGDDRPHAPVERNVWDRGPSAPDLPRVGGGVGVTPAPPPRVQDPAPPPADNSGSDNSGSDSSGSSNSDDDRGRTEKKKSTKRHGWSR